LAIAAALARLDYGHRLGEINRPTLLICGSEDHGAPPENTRQMHAAIKGSRFLAIEQAGHISNIEHPDIFNDAVVRFLGDVDGGAAWPRAAAFVAVPSPHAGEGSA